MKTSTWVELAVGKDKIRYNLNSVYRDRTELVATDGHRLHLSNGLPEVEPHYLDGNDAQFPDWRTVMPKQAPCFELHFSSVAGYRELKKHIAALKRINALLKTFQKAPIVRLELFENNTKAKLCAELPGTLQLSYTLPCEVLVHNPVTIKPIGLNISYLVDALLIIETESCEVKFHGELGPIHFVGNMGKQAIIMPCRLT